MFAPVAPGAAGTSCPELCVAAETETDPSSGCIRLVYGRRISFHRRASVGLYSRDRIAAIAIVLAVTALIAVGGAATASASYPGRPGEIAYLDQYSSNYDPYNGNAPDANSDLLAVRPPSRRLPHTRSLGAASRKLLGCTFTADGSTRPLAGQFCPTAAAFSPDGRQLTFGGEGRGNFGFGAADGVRNLTIASADGRAARHLAQQTADDEQPAFLPGGQTLVFAGRPKPGAPFDLYTVTSSGTGLTQLTSSGAQQPAPCANGSIAFVHRGDVYLLSADHRTQRRLTLRGGNSPDCSPDGRWIAFIRKRDLYLISSSGRRVRRLTTGGLPQGQRPAFSPTGQQIAITATFPCRHSGYCCPDEFSGDCSNGSAGLVVIDLRGRVRWKSLNACGGLFSECHTFGGVAWQPLSSR